MNNGELKSNRVKGRFFIRGIIIIKNIFGRFVTVLRFMVIRKEEDYS